MCVCVCVLPLAQTDSVPLSVRVVVWRGRTSGSVLAVYTPAEEKHCYNQICTIYNHIYTKPDIWSNNHQQIMDSHEYSSTQKWQQWSIRKMTITWLLKTCIFFFFWLVMAASWVMTWGLIGYCWGRQHVVQTVFWHVVMWKAHPQVLTHSE